jgi:hypothetical protein
MYIRNSDDLWGKKKGIYTTFPSDSDELLGKKLSVYTTCPEDNNQCHDRETLATLSEMLLGHRDGKAIQLIQAVSNLKKLQP